MKPIAYTSFLFVSLSSMAAELNWQDLRNDDGVVLVQQIELTGEGGETIAFEPESRLRVLNVSSLPSLPALLASVQFETCTRREQTSGMKLILPRNARNGAEVGVLLLRDCVLDIYIETRDFSGPSFFKSGESV